MAGAASPTLLKNSVLEVALLKVILPLAAIISAPTVKVPFAVVELTLSKLVPAAFWTWKILVASPCGLNNAVPRTSKLASGVLVPMPSLLSVVFTGLLTPLQFQLMSVNPLKLELLAVTFLEHVVVTLVNESKTVI